MADNGVAEVALEESGLITNLVSQDGSIVVDRYRGQMVNIQARKIISSAVDQTAFRNIGTVYHHPDGVAGPRTVYAAVTLLGGSTTTTASYNTVIAGTHITAEFGRATVSGPSNPVVDQFVYFLVDADADYSITAVLGAGSSSATVRSWIEVDSDHP